MSHKALDVSFLCLCPRDTDSFLAPFEHGKVKMLAWTLSTPQAQEQRPLARKVFSIMLKTVSNLIVGSSR